MSILELKPRKRVVSMEDSRKVHEALTRAVIFWENNPSADRLDVESEKAIIEIISYANKWKSKDVTAADFAAKKLENEWLRILALGDSKHPAIEGIRYFRSVLARVDSSYLLGALNTDSTEFLKIYRAGGLHLLYASQEWRTTQRNDRMYLLETMDDPKQSKTLLAQGMGRTGRLFTTVVTDALGIAYYGIWSSEDIDRKHNPYGRWY